MAYRKGTHTRGLYLSAAALLGIVADFLDQAVWQLPILIEIFDLLGRQADLPIIPDR